MNKVITALGTGLLACGLSAGFGLASGVAQASATAPTPVLSASVPQADNYTGSTETATEGASLPARSTLTNLDAGYPASSGLTLTTPYTITVSITNTVTGDIYEAAVCNPDASNPNPLLGVQGPCNGYPGQYYGVGNGGTINISVPFTPGPQNKNQKDGSPGPPYAVATNKDACPTTGHQAAIGDSCIITAADLSEVGTDSIWTGFVGMLFNPKQKTAPVAGSDAGGAATVIWSGTAQAAKVYVTSGFGVEGIDPDTSAPGGCQPFSGATPPASSWTGEPLCAQNEAAGEGYAISTVEPALENGGATTFSGGQINSETSGGSTFVPVPKASGFSIEISCSALAAAGITLSTSAPSSTTLYIEGVGAGAPDFTGATLAVFSGTLKLPKAPKGYTGCPTTSS